MWNPFAAAREDREAMMEVIRLQHEQSMASIDAMHLTAAKMAEASKAQAESFTAYLALFKVQASPETRVMRNEDEYAQELARSGYPVDMSPEDQARWVLAQTDH